MNNDQKKSTLKRQKAFAYFSLVIFALLMYIIAFILAKNFDLQGIFINIGSSLIGVFLVFLLVDQLLYPEENDWLKDKLQLIHERIDSIKSDLFSDQEMYERFSMKEMMEQAETLDLLGHTFHRLLRSHQDSFIQLLNRGGKIRIIFIYPESVTTSADRIFRSRSMIRRNLKASLNIIQKILGSQQQNSGGSLEIRFINWIPSCTLVVFDQDKPSGMIQVTVHPIHEESSLGRLHFLTSSRLLRRWFEYYRSEFERSWDSGRPSGEAF